jgi:hypothetical protein
MPGEPTPLRDSIIEIIQEQISEFEGSRDMYVYELDMRLHRDPPDFGGVHTYAERVWQMELRVRDLKDVLKRVQAG